MANSSDVKGITKYNWANMMKMLPNFIGDVSFQVRHRLH